MRPIRLSKAHRQWLCAWGPVVLWMLVIFALSAIPEVPHQRGLPHARNRQVDDFLREIGHLSEYALLAALFWRALVRKRPAAVAAMWAAACSLLYAASDELHQHFVPGRWCSLSDWLTDLAGIILALAALWATQALRRRKNPGKSSP